MPGRDGFSLLEQLEPPLPAVIFTTAYDEFAVKAFEFNALDYLLKPVDPNRLVAALEKLAPAPRPAALAGGAGHSTGSRWRTRSSCARATAAGSCR